MTLLEVLEQARTLGFLGPGPVEDHVAHAEAFADVLSTPPRRALDLGSGGGVPGLVLAGCWPTSRWTLLEAAQRRAAFLAEAVIALELGDRVTVLPARAEEAGRLAEHRYAYDLVVARSFGRPAVLAECAAPFLGLDGLVIVSDPPVDEPERWPSAGLAQVGLIDAGGPAGPPRLRCLRQAELCGERYPRRTGVPAKRPLW